MGRRFWLFLTFLVCFAPVFAQDDEGDPCQQKMDKNSEKIYKKARDLHTHAQKDEAYELYNEILDEHPEYLEVNYYYAMGLYLPIQRNNYQACTKDKSDVNKALAAFNRIYNVCPYFKIHHKEKLLLLI